MRTLRAAQLKADVASTSPASVVRHLLDANSMSISALAREIGVSQSNLSDMLTGRRSFSKRAIAGIRERFGVSTEIFF